MTLLLTALALLTAAAVLGWCAASRLDPRSTAAPGRVRGMLTVSAWIAATVACVLIVVVGALAVGGAVSGTFSVSDRFGADVLRLDRLSGMFLVITFGIAVPVLLSGIASMRRRGRPRVRLAAALTITMLAVAAVETAGNFFVLYAGWEAVGLTFYLVVGFDRDRPGRQTASVLTAAFSRISGAAVMLGGLLLVAQTHSFTVDSFSSAPHTPGTDTAYALLLAGFGIKVGLAPAHIWLPRAYAAAPPLARAALAGAAVNVGFYGMWRTLDLLGRPPLWLPCTLLLVAGGTAVLGIAHATVNARLPLLVAWSSVENAGLISAAFAVALVGAYVQKPDLEAVGLLAATLQVCAHALGKSLLFVAAAGIEGAYRTTDLDRLRGVGRRLRFSGAGATVGAFTLAGVPLTAGFASEWFIVQSLMQEFRVHVLALNLTLAAAGIMVALTIGVASIAFVRLVALTVFGPPASLPAARPRTIDRSAANRAAILVLIVGCLGAAGAAPLLVAFIAAGVDGIVGTRVLRAVTGSVNLQPVYGGFSSLSPTLLWLVIPGYAVVIGVGATLLSRGRLLRIRRVTTWRSASPGVRGGRGYTSFGFANPLRRVLGGVLLTRRELHRHDHSGDGGSQSDRFGVHAARIDYTVDVVDVVERYVYRPLLRPAAAVVRTAKRLQSGRLDAYMAYMLIALVAVLAVVTAMSQ